MKKMCAIVVISFLVISFVSVAATPDHTAVVTEGLQRFKAWNTQMERGKVFGLLKQFYATAGMQVHAAGFDMTVIGYGGKSVLLLGEPDTLQQRPRRV